MRRSLLKIRHRFYHGPPPQEKEVREVAEGFLCDRVASISRFHNGFHHYVFDVQSVTGKTLAAKFSSRRNSAYLAGNIYWHNLLSSVNVPLPQLYHWNLAVQTPYLLMERLPGTDLENIYDSMSASEKESLVDEVIKIQNTLSSLPNAKGFGAAFSYDDPSLLLQSSWIQVLEDQLEKSRRQWRRGEKYIKTISQLILQHSSYLNSIQPRPFLNDVTLKNILVHKQSLSGMIDIDVLFFGDPLYALAATQRDLLLRKRDLHYARYWTNQLALSSEEKIALHLYTLLFLLESIANFGQPFNGNVPRVSRSQAQTHVETFSSWLSQ